MQCAKMIQLLQLATIHSFVNIRTKSGLKRRSTDIFLTPATSIKYGMFGGIPIAKPQYDMVYSKKRGFVSQKLILQLGSNRCLLYSILITKAKNIEIDLSF